MTDLKKLNGSMRNMLRLFVPAFMSVMTINLYKHLKELVIYQPLLI